MYYLLVTLGGSLSGGSSWQRPPRQRPPPQTETPQTETHLGRDPPWHRPPSTETPSCFEYVGKSWQWFCLIIYLRSAFCRTESRSSLLVDSFRILLSISETYPLTETSPSTETPQSCDLWCMLGQRPSLNRITDRCKNITLPQLRCGR